jgi:hypothetical protein
MTSINFKSTSHTSRDRKGAVRGQRDRAKISGLTLVVVFSLLAYPLTAGAQNSADQPSLDELLEIGEKEAAKEGTPDARDADQTERAPATQPAADRQSDAPATQPADAKQRALDPELEKLLDGRPKGDPFASAVSQMQTVAQRLARQQDAGRNTQRMQREILKKLDQALAQARKQQQKGGGGQGQARRRQRGQNPAEQQDLQRAGQQQRRTAQAGGQNPSGASGEDGSTSARQAESLEALRRQWGNLPPRLRDELSEGLDEQFSPVYQRMTEDYYRRLAEQMREGQNP